ncbi:MAG: tetratricopeptide repeat protein [Deltaproteobacteria bacterium]|nr:tetratricopeptide repeat protein [Deltaproteobacteria bacterium]
MGTRLLPRARVRLSLSLLVAGAVLLAGCPAPEVVRVFDGQQVAGRFIPAEAYAEYARGAEAEARGSDREALAAFLAAAESDEHGAELWARVGAVRCRLRDAEAEEAFARAESLDPGYAPLWHERGLCAERWGRMGDACSALDRALSLDPDREETTIAYARALDRHGEAAAAGRFLRALVVRSPGSAAAWSALAELSERRHEDAWARHARLRLAVLEARRSGRRAAEGAAWDAVEAALLAGDLGGAREQAKRRRLSARQLAPRAIALGRPAVAAEHASLLLEADPADSDARVTLAAAASLLGEPDRARSLMQSLPDDAAELSPAGRALLGELLVRHVGAAAAQLWQSDHEPH